MPNNIAVSITADVADLQVKRAILSAELKTAQKDLNDFARTAKSSGATDELRTKMLAAADSTARLRNQVGLIDREMKNLGAGASGLEAVAGGAAKAGKAMAGLHGGSAGVTRELIVLGREAGRGNFSRMAGSVTILAQRMGLLTPEVLLASVAIGALVAPVVAVVAAFNGAQREMARFQNDIRLTGNYADVTASQFEGMAAKLSDDATIGVGKARSVLEQLMATGRFTGDELQELGLDTTKFSQLSGESMQKVIERWVRLAEQPSKYAEEFVRTYHGSISTAQLEHIRKLEEQGDKEGALAAAVNDLTQWINGQAVAVDGISGRFQVWAKAAGEVADQFARMVGARGPTNSEQIAEIDRQIAHLQQNRPAAASERGRNDQEIARLERQKTLYEGLEAADRAYTDAQAQHNRVQDAATAVLDKSHQTLVSLKSSALEAKEAWAALTDEMAKRKAANPNDAEVKDFYANESKYRTALMHRMDPGDFKKPEKGPGVVQQWQEEFRQAQVTSSDFFGDETKKELAFWRSKIGLTTQGSKEWLEVQGHIYDASKALARSDYQDHLADLNERLEADRDSWSKVQADWQEKLAFIKSKYGEEGAEYKNAYREFEAAEREHQRQMAEIARNGAQEQFNALKSQLQAARSIREADANTAISGIQANARYNPVLGEVQAAQQIAAIHQQLIAKEIADEQTLHDAQMRQLDARIASYAKDPVAYAKAVNEKRAADQAWSTQQAAMADKAANQQIADQQRIASAWHATIDPMVNSIGGQFKGLIEQTEAWQQALLHFGDDALGAVISAVERMTETWAVGELQKTAATQAGAAARTAAGAAEQSPFLARVALELAHWLGLETAKTTATAAGATSRAAAEGAATAASVTAAKLQAAAEIPAYTGIAAMEAAASVAMVPLAGPGLAAAAAGEMVALGASQMALASFAVGANVIPNDMIAQIHAGERIIPAADNRALMAAVGAGPGGGGKRGGDIHLHTNYAPQLVGSGKSFRQQLQDHSSDLESMLQTMIQRLARNGALRV